MKRGMTMGAVTTMAMTPLFVVECLVAYFNGEEQKTFPQGT
jgi:hypothetical protein